MKEIELTKGFVALVSDEDYEALSLFNWHYTSGGYAARNVTRSGKRGKVYMHCDILSPPLGMYVDHIDNNGINNQRENIRVVTNRQNIARATYPAGISQYRGVSPHRGRWQVRVGQKHIGTFETPEDAALAYNIAARDVYGEFAYQNEVA